MVFAKADLCRYGLKSKNGKELLRKPISLLTNSLSFPENIEKTCPGDHDHRVIQGVETAHSAAYPTAFATAVLRTYEKKTTWEFLLKNRAPAQVPFRPLQHRHQHNHAQLIKRRGPQSSQLKKSMEKMKNRMDPEPYPLKGKEFMGLLFEYGLN